MPAHPVAHDKIDLCEKWRLKPGDFFCALFGATEVVPFQKGHL
jgi:hypothetical protein